MKKYLFPVIALFILLMVFVNSSVIEVMAHHPAVTQQADCSGYLFKAEYVGGGGRRRLEWDVTLTIDGIVTKETNTWEGKHLGFIIFEHSGAANNASAHGYVKLMIEDNNGAWMIDREETFDTDFSGNCVTSTPTPTSTPTVTLSATPSATPTATMSVTPTQAPTSTPQPGPTQTPKPEEKKPETTPTPTPDRMQGLDKNVEYGWK